MVPPQVPWWLAGSDQKDSSHSTSSTRTSSRYPQATGFNPVKVIYSLDDSLGSLDLAETTHKSTYLQIFSGMFTLLIEIGKKVPFSLTSKFCCDVPPHGPFSAIDGISSIQWPSSAPLSTAVNQRVKQQLLQTPLQRIVEDRTLCLFNRQKS